MPNLQAIDDIRLSWRSRPSPLVGDPTFARLALDVSQIASARPTYSRVGLAVGGVRRWDTFRPIAWSDSSPRRLKFGRRGSFRRERVVLWNELYPRGHDAA